MGVALALAVLAAILGVLVLRDEVAAPHWIGVGLIAAGVALPALG